MPSSLQEAINVSRRQEVYFKTSGGGGGGGESSMSMYNDDDLTSTKSLALDTSASMNLSKLRRVASESENSMFFQSRVQATVAKPFISKLTHACVKQDDYTHDLSFNKWSGDVALLFVDISGYSKLSAALPGAHDLAEAVNGYFTPIVDIIVTAQGDVLKFAGDAIMVVWAISAARPCIMSCIIAALGCALELQKKAGTYEVPSAPGTQLQLHIACAAHRMNASVMMPPATQKRVMQQAFFFVGGPVLSGLDDIIDNCPPGCVAVSRSIGDRIPLTHIDHADAPGTDGRILLVNRLLLPSAVDTSIPSSDNHNTSRYPVRPEASQNNRSESRISALSCGDVDFITEESGEGTLENDEEADVDALHNDLDEIKGSVTGLEDLVFPPPVLARLRMGLRTEDMAEMRDLVCLFIKKTGSMNITDWFEEVYDVLNGGRCPITQIIEDDKGVHVIASMNLYVSEDGANDAAVRLAQKLMELKISCVVGIASGPCFCGIVGSEKIHRWDITGAACVRACRVMQHAALSGISVGVDQSVIEKMSDPSTLQMYDPKVAMKGSSEPVPVFTLSTNMDSPLSAIAAVNEYAIEVHVYKRDQLREQLINNRDVVCGSALVVGGRMAGKKYLLLTALHGTPFVPIIHRTSRECQRLDICWTIARWFKYHHNPTLRDLAVQISSSMRLRHTSHALLLTLDLIHAAIVSGEHVAFVVDRTQYIDDATLRLIAQASRGDLNRPEGVLLLSASKSNVSITDVSDGAAAPPQGRWIWLFSLSPLLHGQTIRSVRHLAEVTTDTVQLDKLVPEELLAMFRLFAFWDASDAAAVKELTACDGLPGVLRKLQGWYGPQYYAMSLKFRRGEITKEEMGFVSTLNGRSKQGDFADDIYHDISFRKACPEILTSHIQAFDVLHPRQQLVLKVLSAIQHRVPMQRWTWKQVCHIAVVFIPRTSSEMLLHDMLILREIMILEVDDKSESGEVRFVDLSMAEAIFETLTPQQLSQVCKKAIKAIVVSFTGELRDLDDDCVEALFILASRVTGSEGREQRNAFGKQLLRRYLKDHAPGTVPAGSLYTSVEHRLAWHCEWMGIDPSELAVEYPVGPPKSAASPVTEATRTSDSESPKPELIVPKRFPRRPMIIADSKIAPLSWEFAKSSEPALILGPMTGMYMALVHNAQGNFFVARGGAVRTHIPPASGAAYLRLVTKFEAAVGEDATLPKTWRDEEAELVRCLEENTSVAELSATCVQFVAWLELGIKSRSRRLTAFAGTLQNLRPVNAEDREACADLLRAFDFIKHVDETTDPATLPEITSKCLMALAISNWSSPYPYMVPAKLRDVWLPGWLSTIELKGILFMFILEKCQGRISISREATV